MYSTSLRNVISIAFILFVSCAVTTWAAEDLFLSDSAPNWDRTDIYRVDLDASSGRANLTLIRGVAIDEGHALACTPDGERCYLIGKYSADFGYVDLSDNGWYPLPNVVDTNNTIVSEIVLAAFSPGGELFVASQLNDSLYLIDTNTGIATLVGHVEEDINPGVTVDIAGADMAFKADGHLCVWTNSNQTMYNLTLPDTYPGVVVATWVFDRPGTFVTGLAIRGNGYGGPTGSETNVVPNSFLVMDGSYPMYLNGVPFDASYGDMANGWMNLCTLTIGYYKNHSWEGAGVHVCGVAVDEQYGANILWNATGKNFSMLFAQMIAAKLNVGDAGGVPEIDDAENWLCTQENAVDVDNGALFWDAQFVDRIQKSVANGYMAALDDFNNSNHCD